MASVPLPAPRFLRKTTLAPSEYRKNFRQVDNDVIATVTSPEADTVTPLMSKVYLRLLNAPSCFFESAGVLRFSEEVREGKRLTAWALLCDLLNVSSSTANKAIKWMADQGVIGYYAGKNGVGLRIFLNRAVSSVGIRPPAETKKILPFVPASFCNSRASSGEAGFKGDTDDQENLEFSKNSDAPKYGAERRRLEGSLADRRSDSNGDTSAPPAMRATEFLGTQGGELQLAAEMVRTLKAELNPLFRAMAAQAASREHDRTREWLEKRGLPKVARVAQREAFNVLRQCGSINPSARRARSELMVGGHGSSHSGPRPLSPGEIEETAEICLWMLESRGQSIDLTLAGISAEAGGYLLAEDVPKVRELAYSALGKENYKVESRAMNKRD
jgi:hypothetical protein